MTTSEIYDLAEKTYKKLYSPESTRSWELIEANIQNIAEALLKVKESRLILPDRNEVNKQIESLTDVVQWLKKQDPYIKISDDASASE